MEELTFIKKVIKEAFEKIDYQKKITVSIKESEKFKNDFVTSCDIDIENYIISKIKKKYPKDTIISEESNSQKHLKGRTWILDPIDGTVNFVYGLPIWCCQLAFAVNQKCKFSVIYIPTTNEWFIADKNKATLNGKKLVVNKNLEVQNSIVCISSLVSKQPKIYNLQTKLIKDLGKQFLGVKFLGSAGYEFASVASNRMQAFIIFTNTIWDILPGMHLCKMCGCELITTEYDGLQINIACANKEIKNKILEKLKI